MYALVKRAQSFLRRSDRDHKPPHAVSGDTPGIRAKLDVGVFNPQRHNLRRKNTMPHPVDIALGKRIYQMRRNYGMTQTDMARKIGVTFQQVQKYEIGQNRISASRLVMIAGALNSTASDLMRDMEDV